MRAGSTRARGQPATHCLPLQTDLAQISSRATELASVTDSLTKRRDALASQSAALLPRLSELHLRLDESLREHAKLLPLVEDTQKVVDKRSATLGEISSRRVAIDNVTIALLVDAAAARRAAYAIGQEVYALRNPEATAALDKAAAIAAAGAHAADGPLDPLSDAQLEASRDTADLTTVIGDIQAARSGRRRAPLRGRASEDASELELVLGDIDAAKAVAARASPWIQGDSPAPLAGKSLFRFRAEMSAAGPDDGIDDVGDSSSAAASPTPSPSPSPDAEAVDSSDTSGGRQQAEKQRNAAARALGLTKASLDRASDERQRWLEDKRNVAAKTLDLKARMDDLSARVDALRDVVDRGSTAFEDARTASDELAFQITLLTQAAVSARESNAAAAKEAANLDVKRADVSHKIDEVQQLRVTRVVDLQASIRSRLEARAAASQKLNSLQRERLELAQSVSGATERTKLVENDIDAALGQTEGYKRREDSLEKRRAVLTAELRSAVAREIAAREGMEPLAQQRKRLDAAAVIEAAARERLSSLVSRGAAAIETAKADLERRVAMRKAVAASISTLQLKLGAAEEEFSSTGASSLQATLELDRLVLRRRALDSDALRLSQRISEARASLTRAEERQTRAENNLRDLRNRVERYTAVRTQLLPPSASPSPRPPIGNATNSSLPTNATVASNATAAAPPASFAGRIQQQLSSLMSTVQSRARPAGDGA